MPKSKSKKRKLAHAQPYSNNAKSNTLNSTNEHLSHEEIWDDSALLRSWDEAVAEYEFYHSIHARGEDVDEVLRQHHASNSEGYERDSDVEGGQASELEEGEDSEIVEDALVEGKVRNVVNGDALEVNLHHSNPTPKVIEQFQKADSISSTLATNQDFPIHQPQVQMSTQAQPQAQLQTQPNNDAANQTLENLKMAYYWAGYYSGLYDGQNQAQTVAAVVPPATTVTGNEKEDGEV